VNKAVKISHAAFYYAMDEFEDVTNGSAYAAAATKRQNSARCTRAHQGPIGVNPHEWRFERLRRSHRAGENTRLSEPRTIFYDYQQPGFRGTPDKLRNGSMERAIRAPSCLLFRPFGGLRSLPQSRPPKPRAGRRRRP